MSTIAILLAAGGGHRFDGPTHKLNAPLGSTTVAATAVKVAIDASIGDVIVVTGASEIVNLPAAATIVHHPGWADGQATSLSVGIDAARQRGANAVVVGLADQPGIPRSAWRSVAAASAPIAVANYDGQRRNPVRLAASIWSLLPAAGDHGARTLMRLRPDLVEDVACKGEPADIDTLEDLHRWQSKSSTNLP